MHLTGIVMLNAVAEFLKQYLEIQNDALYRGYGNRMALPGRQCYVVLAMLDTLRIGTNIQLHTKSEQSLRTPSVLIEYIISVDFCSIDNEAALQKATTLEILSNDLETVRFFNEQDMGFHYAENIDYLPFVAEQDEYIHRYRVNLHIGSWRSTDLKQEYAEDVRFGVIKPAKPASPNEPSRPTRINRIENVDVHHKP